MNQVRLAGLTICALTVAFLCLNPTSARSDDSDIFGANIEPNVMILFDNSRSMNDEIDSSSYNPATTYSGSFSSGVVFRRINDENSLYKSTVDEVPSASARTALNLAGFWTGSIGGTTVSLYTGNYLNYEACTTCNVSTPKLEIARQVAADIVANVDGVRFGVMTFRDHGGEMVAEIGTDRTTMVSAINNITAPGGVGTPLGDQLFDADNYFRGLYNPGDDDDGGGFASPIQYECQPNFVIMISDGLHTRFNRDVRVVAQSNLPQDHSSTFKGTQSVIVHTVGFNIPGATQNELDARDVLITTAANGRGSFFEANNAAELAAALQDAIRLIVGAVFTFATPVVPTTSATGSTRAYIAAVQTDPEINFWSGFLKAYDRDTDGTIRLNTDGTPDAKYLAWEAGNVLTQKTAANRTIYMEKIKPALGPFTGQRVEFVPANVPRGVVGAADNAERDDIVNFIRGVDVYDEDADADVTEDRAWKLGDIFHSTPVLVSPPFLPIADSSYAAFRQAQANRPTVLIVGANDGMIHAFAESDDPDGNFVAGEELWAYVPFDVLDGLKDLTTISGEHPFFMDSSPVAVDIKVDDAWKTIVIIGMRRGGTSYFALDVTDTTDPYLLWKNAENAGIGFTDTRMGETWSEPAVGKIRWTDGTDKYVAFFGGGYDTAENNAFGKAFYMIDLATGTKLGEYYNDGSNDDRQYMNFSLAANPTAVDLDLDGYIDRVYIGDVGGQMWKFEPTLTTSTPDPITYTYEFIDKDSLIQTGDFTKPFADGITFVDLKLASDVAGATPPDPCPANCWTYDPNTDGGSPEAVPESERADVLGYVSLPFSDTWGNGATIGSMVFISQNGGTSTTTFSLEGKRLFAADISQANPPAAGEYFPAQAIYSAPSVAKDDHGNIWVSFGTGDRNRPLNTSTNRFYGIKDNTSMTNGGTLTESNLQQIDSSVSSVSTSIQGWYFTLAANEKVLAQADTFNNTVFFTTFTPESTATCGGGGGTARLYAVTLTSGMAAMDFDTGDALANTSGSVLKSTVIGTGIPSKPAVMIDPNGNPSVITGTTSQQISSVPAPPIASKQLLGWREVF